MEQALIFVGGLIGFGILLGNEYKRVRDEEKAEKAAALAYYSPNKHEHKKRVLVSAYMRSA